MWENVEIDLGLVHTEIYHVISFKFIGECTPESVEVHTSCGCSNGRWNGIARTLEVSYRSGKIPPQVVGNQHIRKSVKISYLCNGNKCEEDLFFKAQLVNE